MGELVFAGSGYELVCVCPPLQQCHIEGELLDRAVTDARSGKQYLLVMSEYCVCEPCGVLL